MFLSVSKSVSKSVAKSVSKSVSKRVVAGEIVGGASDELQAGRPGDDDLKGAG